jgi:phosphoglycolate phosphatase-like HAD superfamily hydrolase
LRVWRCSESPADNAAYVGDSPSDIQAALAALVYAVAVTWGVFDAVTLEAESGCTGPYYS